MLAAISALDIASIWIFVTSKDPIMFALSSQILPFDRFTKIIFHSSIAFLILSFERGCPNTFLTRREDKNCPTLFVIGAMASSLCLSCHLLNSEFQNFNKTASCTCEITSSRKSLSVRTRKICINVAFGYSITESTTLRRIYSNLGPHELSNSFWKVETTHEAILFFSSSLSACKRLNQIGYSVSDKSKSITSFILFDGIDSIIVSTSSPCGSSKHNPFQAFISEIIIFEMIVDFHVHVFQTIYTWRNLSSSLIQKRILSHL